VQDSAFPPDLRVSNIKGFSQKITMKMNRLAREDGRDQHLRMDIADSHIHILDQVDINAFMGMLPCICSPPLLGIVEHHAGQKEKTRDPFQVIQLYK